MKLWGISSNVVFPLSVILQYSCHYEAISDSRTCLIKDSVEVVINVFILDGLFCEVIVKLVGKSTLLNAYLKFIGIGAEPVSVFSTLLDIVRSPRSSFSKKILSAEVTFEMVLYVDILNIFCIC